MVAPVSRKTTVMSGHSAIKVDGELGAITFHSEDTPDGLTLMIGGADGMVFDEDVIFENHPDALALWDKIVSACQRALARQSARSPQSQRSYPTIGQG